MMSNREPRAQDLDMMQAIEQAKKEMHLQERDKIRARIISKTGCIDRVEIISSAR